MIILKTYNEVSVLNEIIIKSTHGLLTMETGNSPHWGISVAKKHTIEQLISYDALPFISKLISSRPRRALRIFFK